MANKTRIIIVDDHAMMRDGIRSILEKNGEFDVVAEAENGRDAVELASKHAPDLILMDVAMPGLNGMEATRKVLAGDPHIAIIGLSMHSDERYITGMLDAGAKGYLLKTCGADELRTAIAVVMRKKIYVTPDLTHVLVDRMHQGGRNETPTGTPPADSLTPREREVLQLIAEGMTSKEAAAQLGTSVKTVETHRTNLIRKLDLHSIAQLTKYAIREGLTGLAH
ncbi:MAG: response regulator [Phycisphaerales bacterium]